MEDVFRECAEEHWLVLEYGDHQPVRLNARALDGIVADGQRLLLDSNDFIVALNLKSAPEAARQIAEQLQPHTRSASRHEAVLFVGDLEISARGHILCAGDYSYGFDEAWAMTDRGELLEASNGGFVRPELTMFAFAHQFRFDRMDIEEVEGGRLLIRSPDVPLISLNARFLDAVSSEGDELFFQLHDERVSVRIARGADHAAALVTQLAPYTRGSPISDVETYEHAKAALANGSTGDFLTVGDDRVVVTAEHVVIGKRGFRIDEVEGYADRGGTIPLAKGSISAVLVWLAIAQSRRRENLEVLAKRVAEYEAKRGS